MSRKFKKFRKIIAVVISPIVFYTLFTVYNNNAVSTSYAVDPLIVTYDGGPPPNPMFTVSNMMPGDETEKTFNVKNDSAEDEDVFISALMTSEEKNFSEILDLEIEDMDSSTLLYSGKLNDFFSLTNIDLGSFPSGIDKNFRVKVRFPSDAGNEYQEAKVVFNFTWYTGVENEIPEECSFLLGKQFSIIYGTEGNDNLNGDAGNNLIFAYGGEDRVNGHSGDDCIVGGDGNDVTLNGGNGNDVILGGDGNDRILGGDDNDIIYAGAGNDNVRGGDNDDVIYAGDGNDNIDGGQGKDLILGGEGNDHLDGGASDDFIDGENGNDTIFGGSGDDNLFGSAGNDNIHGGSGQDNLDGGADTDTLHGGSNTDTCTGGESYSSCENII